MAAVLTPVKKHNCTAAQCVLLLRGAPTRYGPKGSLPFITQKTMPGLIFGAISYCEVLPGMVLREVCLLSRRRLNA